MNKLVLAISIIFIAVGIYLIFPPALPHNPYISTSYPSYKQISGFKVIGFLPHWNSNKLTKPAADSLTDIAYFSLKILGTGEIEKLITRTEEEPGWTTYKRLLKNKPEIPLTLVFSQAKNDEIKKLLDNERAWRILSNNIISELEASNATGVNIDIEPTYLASDSDRQKFTKFTQTLSESIKSKYPKTKISIDVYPTAAKGNRIWDLGELKEHVDYIVIMGYDYHQASSDFAGPPAPLRGTPLELNEDITKNLEETLELVPPNQIILAIPFYGYEWTTYTNKKYSQAESGQVASLERVEQLIKEKNLNVLWDRNTLTPYIIQESEGEIAQIYFENENSISLKIDLAINSKLAGIAIWAIGYEGYNPNLWKLINAKTN